MPSKVSERLVKTPQAYQAYRDSTLFHLVVDIVRIHEDKRDGVEVLGGLLADICKSRQEWVDLAVKRFNERPPDYFITSSEAALRG